MVVENPCEGLTKITADNGKKITNKERSLFVDFLYLGINDSTSNYEEVGREIWKHFVQEENPDIAELQNVTHDLQEKNYNLEDILIDTDFKLMMLEMEKEYGEM